MVRVQTLKSKVWGVIFLMSGLLYAADSAPASVPASAQPAQAIHEDSNAFTDAGGSDDESCCPPGQGSDVSVL